MRLLIGRSRRPGEGDVEINFILKDKPEGRALSMTGDIWLPSRRDIVSGGQCQDTIRQMLDANEILLLEPEDKVRQMLDIWDRWHLNDMHAGCEHQRAEWEPSKQLDVISYHLTTAAHKMRDGVRARAADAALRGEPFNPTPTERALAELQDWLKPRFTLPDADSPLAGCYEFEKRETRRAGHTRPTEHPEGLLGKPCHVCGYKYGTAWKFEAIPLDVLAIIQSW